MLEFILYVVIFTVVFLGALALITRLTQHVYKAEWVDNGRADRARGYGRFTTKYAWIQRYYDLGYYEKDKV